MERKVATYAITQFNKCGQPNKIIYVQKKTVIELKQQEGRRKKCKWIVPEPRLPNFFVCHTQRHTAIQYTHGHLCMTSLTKLNPHFT